MDEHLEARFDLAWCDYHTGRWSAAYRGLNSMLQLSRFVGDQGRATMARAWIAIILAAMGDFATAISQGKDALSMALSRGDRRGELYSQLALADAYTSQTNRDSEARYHANQALAVALSLRSDRAEAECRLRLARLGWQAGDQAELVDAATRSLALAEKLGARHLECLALCWLAQADFAKSDRAERALKIAEQIGLSEGIWRARSLSAGHTDTTAQLTKAIENIARLRDQLIQAGLSDTLLENEECLSVYLRLYQRLIDTGDAIAARDLLESAAWPPLQIRVGNPS